jgi:exocyst complex component 4
MELRTQTIHALIHALAPSTAPYILEQAVKDPDPRILGLNASIVAFDGIVTSHLRAAEQSFIRTGLGLVIDTILVSNATVIRAMNKHGCGRMQLNLLVLQQNLKNIEQTASLERAEAYYDLFTEGPEAIVAFARERRHSGHKPFTYEEMKTLLELCFSEGMGSADRGVSTAARRLMGEKLLQLSEVMWQS